MYQMHKLDKQPQHPPAQQFPKYDCLIF